MRMSFLSWLQRAAMLLSLAGAVCVYAGKYFEVEIDTSEQNLAYTTNPTPVFAINFNAQNLTVVNPLKLFEISGSNRVDVVYSQALGEMYVMAAVENASPVVQDVRERVSNTVAQQLDDDTVQERLQSARARLADVKSWAFTMLASTVDRAQEAWNGGTDAAGEGATRAPAPPPERAPAPGYGGL